MADATIPDGMTAEKLRYIATSLDLLAELTKRHILPNLTSDDPENLARTVETLRGFLDGDDQQDDLRSWADAIERAGS